MAVRCIEERAFEGNKVLVKFAGLSTDSKPTAGIVTGSVFVEVDTGDAYLYDEHGAEWDKVGGS